MYTIESVGKSWLHLKDHSEQPCAVQRTAVCSEHHDVQVDERLADVLDLPPGELVLLAKLGGISQ